MEDAGTFDLKTALANAARSDPSSLAAHLVELERDVEVSGTLTRLHCYFLPLDAHGRVRFKPLAEYLRDQIINYAIPRKTVEEALTEAYNRRDAAVISRLHERARRLFTHLSTTGEGGELLLFAMAEALFNFPQIICKMTLKTSSNMHYHGSDGVYASLRSDGGLDLFWGESKMHKDAGEAIRACLHSLTPYVKEPDGEDAEREQDILLINEFANFSDERMVHGLQQFLKRDDRASLQLRHGGIALAAFSSDAYPAEGLEATMDAIVAALKTEMENWLSTVERRVHHHGLVRHDIHFICVPMPCADTFRQYFLQILGLKHES